MVEYDTITSRIVVFTAETQSKLRTLERATKSMKSEKGILQEEATSLRGQVADKDKDLRGVKGQLQEAQDELSKLTSKLSDMRSQKVKFSRLAREKGEEIGGCGLAVCILQGFPFQT